GSPSLNTSRRLIPAAIFRNAFGVIAGGGGIGFAGNASASVKGVNGTGGGACNASVPATGLRTGACSASGGGGGTEVSSFTMLALAAFAFFVAARRGAPGTPGSAEYTAAGWPVVVVAMVVCAALGLTLFSSLPATLFSSLPAAFTV